MTDPYPPPAGNHKKGHLTCLIEDSLVPYRSGNPLQLYESKRQIAEAKFKDQMEAWLDSNRSPYRLTSLRDPIHGRAANKTEDPWETLLRVCLDYIHSDLMSYTCMLRASREAAVPVAELRLDLHLHKEKILRFVHKNGWVVGASTLTMIRSFRRDHSDYSLKLWDAINEITAEIVNIAFYPVLEHGAVTASATTEQLLTELISRVEPLETAMEERRSHLFAAVGEAVSVHKYVSPVDTDREVFDLSYLYKDSITSELIQTRKMIISSYRSKNDLTVPGLAMKAGMSEDTLRGIIREDRPRFALEKRNNLLKILGVTIGKWYGQ